MTIINDIGDLGVDDLVFRRRHTNQQLPDPPLGDNLGLFISSPQFLILVIYMLADYLYLTEQ